MLFMSQSRRIHEIVLALFGRLWPLDGYPEPRQYSDMQGQLCNTKLDCTHSLFPFPCLCPSDRLEALIIVDGPRWRRTTINTIFN